MRRVAGWALVIVLVGGTVGLWLWMSGRDPSPMSTAAGSSTPAVNEETDDATSPDDRPVARVPRTRSRAETEPAPAADDTAGRAVPPAPPVVSPTPKPAPPAGSETETEMLARMSTMAARWDEQLDDDFARAGALRELGAALRSEDFATLRAGLAVAARHPDEFDPRPHRDTLVELLQTSDGGTRVRVAKLLQRHEMSVDVTAIVAPMVRSEDLNLRTIAPHVLRALAGDDLRTEGDALLVELLSDPEPMVLTTTLTVMRDARIGPLATARLIRMVETAETSHPTWMGPLGGLVHKPVSLVEALARVAEDPEHPAARTAVGVLGRGVAEGSRARVVEAARRILAAPDDSGRHAAAVDLLAVAGGDDALAELRRIADDEREFDHVRRRAASALERLRDAESE